MVQIDVREAPGRSKGAPGSISVLKHRKTGPKILIFTPCISQAPAAPQGHLSGAARAQIPTKPPTQGRRLARSWALRRAEDLPLSQVPPMFATWKRPQHSFASRGAAAPRTHRLNLGGPHTPTHHRLRGRRPPDPPHFSGRTGGQGKRYGPIRGRSICGLQHRNCHEMALELISGADFWCKLMSWGRPVDLRGSRGRFPS